MSTPDSSAKKKAKMNLTREQYHPSEKSKQEKEAYRTKVLAVCQALPKIELHLHLDGSLPEEFILSCYNNEDGTKKSNLALPPLPYVPRLSSTTSSFFSTSSISPLSSQAARKEPLSACHSQNSSAGTYYDAAAAGTMQEHVHATKKLNTDFASVLAIFFFLVELLQTKEALSDAAYRVCNTLREQDNVWWLELRFCPALHTRGVRPKEGGVHQQPSKALTEQEAIMAVQEGMRKAEMRGGVIVCALRSNTCAESLRMAELTVRMYDEQEQERERERGLGQESDENRRKDKRKGGRVIGFDIAGDEERYPLALHSAALAVISAHPFLGLTVHCGEWNSPLSTARENFLCAVQYGAQRIGHGCNLVPPSSSSLFDVYGKTMAIKKNEEEEEEEWRRGVIVHLKKNNVLVEVCLTSNVGCTNMGLAYQNHPLLPLLRQHGLRCSLSCDNLLVSGNFITGPARPTSELARFVLDCGGTWQEVKQLIVNGAQQRFEPSLMVKAGGGGGKMQPPPSQQQDDDEFVAAVKEEIDRVYRQFDILSSLER